MKNKLGDSFIALYKKIWRSVIAFGSFVLLFVLFKIFNFSVNKSPDAYKDYYNSHYKIFSMRIPKNLNFCEEKVPVNDFTVAESIDREILVNTYWHSQTLLLFKRACRWFPVIEPILKKNGIPDDFKYIALIESGLTNIVSPAGATGYWQLLESTALGYGLEINESIDERYNMEKSTEAACKYFKEAYSHFNNWTLTAASYNMGIGGIEAHLKKQHVSSYYDLYLNEETARYVYRILALKDIFTRPQQYGFVIRKSDLYKPIPIKKVEIDSSITDLTSFALQQGVTYKVFRLMNPWIRKENFDNPSNSKYTLVVPANGVDYTKWENFLESDSGAILSGNNTFQPINKFVTDSIQ